MVCSSGWKPSSSRQDCLLKTAFGPRLHGHVQAVSQMGDTLHGAWDGNGNTERLSDLAQDSCLICRTNYPEKLIVLVHQPRASEALALSLDIFTGSLRF